MATCSYQGCNFQSKVYFTFNAHNSKELQNEMAFRPENVSDCTPEELPPNLDIQHEKIFLEIDDGEFEVTDVCEDVEDLKSQLEHNVADLFLKMSSILNISENVLQEVTE